MSDVLCFFVCVDILFSFFSFFFFSLLFCFFLFLFSLSALDARGQPVTLSPAFVALLQLPAVSASFVTQDYVRDLVERVAHAMDGDGQEHRNKKGE